MSEQTGRRKRQAPKLNEGDNIQILSTPATPERIGKILLKEGQWCLVQIETDVVWIPLKAI